MSAALRLMINDRGAWRHVTWLDRNVEADVRADCIRRQVGATRLGKNAPKFKLLDAGGKEVAFLADDKKHTWRDAP